VSYGASKNALESYTMAAAWELGPFGITANVVCPPATDTGWITPKVTAEVIRSSPLGHVGQPEEVAELVVLLASHQARFVTARKKARRPGTAAAVLTVQVAPLSVDRASFTIPCPAAL